MTTIQIPFKTKYWISLSKKNPSPNPLKSGVIGKDLDWKIDHREAW